MQKLVSGYNIGLRNTTGTNSADTAYSDQLQKIKKQQLLVLYHFHDLARHGHFHYTLSFQSLGSETAQFQCKPLIH